MYEVLCSSNSLNSLVCRSLQKALINSFLLIEFVINLLQYFTLLPAIMLRKLLFHYVFVVQRFLLNNRNALMRYALCLIYGHKNSIFCRLVFLDLPVSPDRSYNFTCVSLFVRSLIGLFIPFIPFVRSFVRSFVQN